MSDAPLKVFVCIKFKGYFPVWSAAVVVATDKAEACELLMVELTKYGLKQDITEDMIIELNTLTRKAVILVDGDY